MIKLSDIISMCKEGTPIRVTVLGYDDVYAETVRVRNKPRILLDLATLYETNPAVMSLMVTRGGELCINCMDMV